MQNTKKMGKVKANCGTNTGRCLKRVNCEKGENLLVQAKHW